MTEESEPAEDGKPTEETMADSDIGCCLGIVIVACIGIVIIAFGVWKLLTIYSTPDTAITAKEAMNKETIRIGSYPTVKGKPENIGSIAGLFGFGSDKGAVVTLEGEKGLIIYLPERHPLAIAIHEEDVEEVSREWELVGKIETGEDTEAPSRVIKTFAQNNGHSLEMTRVLNTELSSSDATFAGIFGIVGGSICFLVMLALGGLFVLAMFAGEDETESDAATDPKSDHA